MPQERGILNAAIDGLWVAALGVSIGYVAWLLLSQ